MGTKQSLPGKCYSKFQFEFSNVQNQAWLVWTTILISYDRPNFPKSHLVEFQCLKVIKPSMFESFSIHTQIIENIKGKGELI